MDGWVNGCMDGYPGTVRVSIMELVAGVWGGDEWMGGRMDVSNISRHKNWVGLGWVGLGWVGLGARTMPNVFKAVAGE